MSCMEMDVEREVNQLFLNKVENFLVNFSSTIRIVLVNKMTKSLKTAKASIHLSCHLLRKILFLGVPFNC